MASTASRTELKNGSDAVSASSADSGAPPPAQRCPVSGGASSKPQRPLIAARFGQNNLTGASSQNGTAPTNSPGPAPGRRSARSASASKRSRSRKQPVTASPSSSATIVFVGPEKKKLCAMAAFPWVRAREGRWSVAFQAPTRTALPVFNENENHFHLARFRLRPRRVRRPVTTHLALSGALLSPLAAHAQSAAASETTSA